MHILFLRCSEDPAPSFPCFGPLLQGAPGTPITMSTHMLIVCYMHILQLKPFLLPLLLASKFPSLHLQSAPYRSRPHSGQCVVFCTHSVRSASSPLLRHLASVSLQPLYHVSFHCCPEMSRESSVRPQSLCYALLHDCTLCADSPLLSAHFSLLLCWCTT